jgi:hypothetical protein
MNKVEICGEKLKDPLLLVNIVKEVQSEGIVGEEDTILAIIMKIMLRNVKGADATSSNIVVSDKSGGGKDVLTELVCKVMLPKHDYFHRTGLTEKVFRYWNSNKKDFTWNGKVIHLEDPEEDLIKSQGFRTMASGGSDTTVVDNMKAVDLKVNGKPVIIVTSLNANIDMEGIRRWDTIRMDTGKMLTEKVIERGILKKTGLIEDVEDKELREALHSIITPMTVSVPYGRKITKIFPNTIAMRTISRKFIDYIMASAVLHQYQRERDERGRIIATWDDYEYARFVFTKLTGMYGVPLNRAEETFMQVLIESGEPLSIKEIAERFDHSSNWIYRHVRDDDKFKETGLIHEISVWDERSNKDITKYYTKLTNIKVTLIPSHHLIENSRRGTERFSQVFSPVSHGGEYNALEEEKIGDPVFSFFRCARLLNENRLKAGLSALHDIDSFIDISDNSYLPTFCEKTTPPTPLGLWETSEKTCKNREKTNLTGQEENGCEKTKIRQESISLSDNIMDLQAKITQNRESGYSITYQFLINNFNKEFIDKCIQEGVLINNGKEYGIKYS